MAKKKLNFKSKIKLTKLRGKMRVKITCLGLPPTFKNITKEQYENLKMMRKKRRRKR